MKKLFITLFSMGLLISCSQQGETEINYGSWLKGDQQHFVEEIEEQFGGFSAAMTEVAYRYEELYWAGMDGNWAYADYQLEHIEEAIEAGVTRRPDRGLNAGLFLKSDQQKMQRIIDEKDMDGFQSAFNAYRQACIACHEREDVSFIPVNLPKVRSGITWTE